MPMNDRSDAPKSSNDRLAVARTAHLWRERRSQAELSAADRRAFETWLRTDYRHAQAFERATEVWDSLADLPADDYSVATRRAGWPERWYTFKQRTVWLKGVSSKPGAAVFTVGVIALLAVGVFTAGTPREGQPTAVHSVRVSTPVGEFDTVTLVDGSVLTLGPGSTVDVKFDHQFRDIHVQRGTVFLDVAPEKGRPLRAIAGDLRAQALGTRFSVKHAANVARVGVAEGVVRVSYPLLIAGKPSVVRSVQRLKDGQQIAALRFEGLQNVEVVRPESVGAWRHHKLDYARATVAELVDDLRRFSSLEVSIEDPKGMLDTETFTAYFDARDIRALVQKLPAVLAVEVKPAADGALVIRPAVTDK